MALYGFMLEVICAISLVDMSVFIICHIHFKTPHRRLWKRTKYISLLNNMTKTALIRLNHPVSYSSSAQLNIYSVFRPRANTAVIRIGPG